MADYILKEEEENGMTFPGWEPERMAHLGELFRAYKGVTKEKLWDNLKYFLESSCLFATNAISKWPFIWTIPPGTFSVSRV